MYCLLLFYIFNFALDSYLALTVLMSYEMEANALIAPQASFCIFAFLHYRKLLNYLFTIFILNFSL